MNSYIYSKHVQDIYWNKTKKKVNLVGYYAKVMGCFGLLVGRVSFRRRWFLPRAVYVGRVVRGGAGTTCLSHSTPVFTCGCHTPGNPQIIYLPRNGRRPDSGSNFHTDVVVGKEKM